jgi:hypothetical protein
MRRRIALANACLGGRREGLAGVNPPRDRILCRRRRGRVGHGPTASSPATPSSWFVDRMAGSGMSGGRPPSGQARDRANGRWPGGRRPPKRPRRSSTMGNARMRDHSGAHGVELDVRAASEKISLAVDRCRPVASLPQRADSTVGGIDVSDAAPAEGLDRAWQAVFVARCHQQMRVVGDQRIGMDRAIIGRCGLREPGAGMMV